jgi:DNA-binding IclR family transcriptional regulator
MTGGSRLVVGDGAMNARRVLGPSAWAALETLASVAVERGGEQVATSSVRDVALVLGVAPNTAHRAIRRLIAAGLVEPDQQRTADGRFLAGTYRLTIPADVLDLQSLSAEPSKSTSNSASQTRQRRTRRNQASQLELLTSWD